MSHSRNKPPLGAVLQQAGLVSAEQVNQALQQQKQISSDLKIGEILALQGRIDPQTADFFAEAWDSAVAEQPKQRIGQYLKQAALLNEQQIQEILAEQQRDQRKFGELAIAKGWLKQATLDFFLRYLRPGAEAISIKVEQSLAMPENTIALANMGDAQVGQDNPADKLQGLDQSPQPDNSAKVQEGFLQIKRKLLKIEAKGSYSAKTLARVLFWTGGNSVLTQKIFALITEATTPISPPQEEEHVDYLVQTQVIDRWSQNKLSSHLQGISDRLVNNRNCPVEQLLMEYQKILAGTALPDSSPPQQELLSLGLAIKQQNRLAVANRIYQSVFDLSWTIETLNEQVRSKLNGNDLSANSYRHSRAIVATPPKENQDSAESWFKLKNLLLLLALLGLVGILINNISQRFTVRKSFLQGNELLKQKSYPEAIKEYNKLLKVDSNYFQAWTNRGYALAGLQKYEAMRESCSTATIIDPKAVYAWNCQGEALHNLEQYSEAITAFERAIALNPDDPIFSINKSESLRALGDDQASTVAIQEAIAALEKIEASEGSKGIEGEFAVALTLLGNRHRQAKKYPEAIAAYERAITYSSNYFPARLSKGITFSRAQKYSQAEREFKSMLKDEQLSTGQQAQTWFYLGKTQCKLGKNAEGINAFNRSLQLNPDYTIAQNAKQQCN